MINKLVLTVVAIALTIMAGCGSTSIPGVPTGLTVTSTAPITLRWTGVSGVSGYSVYRGTATGTLTTKTLLASNVAGSTYADTSAVIGTTYYYQVRAMNANGSSDGSNEASATATQATTPTQATNLFGLKGTKDGVQIKLEWYTIFDTLVTDIVSYNVYRSTTSSIVSSKTKLTAVPIPTTYYFDTTITPVTTYYYIVTAVKADGTEFQESAEVSVAL